VIETTWVNFDKRTGILTGYSKDVKLVETDELGAFETTMELKGSPKRYRVDNPKNPTKIIKVGGEI